MSTDRKLAAKVLNRWRAAYNDWSHGRAASPSADDLVADAATVMGRPSAIDAETVFNLQCEGWELSLIAQMVVDQ